MKAVVFQAPFDVRAEDRPVPHIENPTDVVLKVKYSGLCGTDLHTYRGHISGPVGQIIGHEFLGTVAEVGKSVTKFKVGDEVLSTFTIQCGECFYCTHGYSGQCVVTNTFGKKGLPGGQAEYVRVPYAESTLVHKPQSDDGIDDSVYVMMADIFITGYYGVKKIIDFLQTEQRSIDGTEKTDFSDVTVLQVGIGPVGLCALHVFKHFGFKKIVVVDSVPARLQEATSRGAFKAINFEKDPSALKDFIKNETNGLGFDVVLEGVGAAGALKTAYESVRGNGFISSIGMAHGALPFEGLECYVKNINISFGRCHAWSLFGEALKIFELLKRDFVTFIDAKAKVDDAPQAFALFDQHKANKIVFDFT